MNHATQLQARLLKPGERIWRGIVAHFAAHGVGRLETNGKNG